MKTYLSNFYEDQYEQIFMPKKQVVLFHSNWQMFEI